MSKEIVKLDLTGVTTELPYRDYYRGRNGIVAKNIANYLGLPYFSEESLNLDGKNVYLVPPVTQTKEGVEAKRLETPQDFYGLAVEDINQVGKAILHESLTKPVPGFYSSAFAKSVKELVLPGITIFSKEDLGRGFKFLKREGFLEIRLKLSDKSDGHGQYLVENYDQFKKAISGIQEEEIVEKGLVLEANLKEAKTISIGFAVLGVDTFSFIALQKNDVDQEDGRNRYLGAYVRSVKGEMKDLIEVVNDPMERKALEESIKFYEKYRYFNPIASRLSFDFLYGYDGNGNSLSGVTDITGRLGGTCPAISLSALEFKKTPKLSMIESEVSLNYDPKEELECEKRAVRFIDLPSLRLSARVNSTK